MRINAGRLGPAATRAGGGIWSIPEHYQQVRGGFWVLPTATGGTLTSDDTYFYRTFTSSGTFTVSGGTLATDVLVIAGGGGGASGGGGAGGLLAQSFLATAQNYSIVVGAGGSGRGATISGSTGNNGVDSSAFGFTAVGGGRGGNNDTSAGATAGGSGGGGGSTSTAQTTGGAGTAGQGNAGGTVTSTFFGPPYPSAGGGGAGQVGQPPVNTTTSGAGGVGSLAYSNWGLATSTGQNVSGTVYYAGGGGGTTWQDTPVGAGGLGGGGIGGSPNGAAGTANTGGGGGGGKGGQSGSGGNGGSGLVIVRYLKAAVSSPALSWAPDTLASNLRIALPLNATLGTADYSASISGVGTNRTVTVVNSGAITASQSKFYGSSYDNGTESQDKYLSIPNSSDLSLGTSDFCIEGWWYPTANNIGYHVLASHSGDNSDQQNGWVLTTETNNTLYFYATDAAGGWDVTMGGGQTPTTNAWHHIAVTRSGNVFRLFYNGTQVNTQTVSVNIALPSSREFRLGSYRWIPGNPQSFNGLIQDFRMYIGAAKYTSNFTPPTAIYTGS